MSQKVFILDIIVNKLDLYDDRFKDASNLLVKFSFDDIRLDITTSRINVADFGEGRSIEFSSTLDALKKKLKNNPLKLSILNRNFVNSGEFLEKVANEGSEVGSGGGGKGGDEGDGEGGGEENEKSSAVVPQKLSEIVGVVTCNWPENLIEKLKDDSSVVIPHIQICEIMQNDVGIGNITLAIMLHCKCTEDEKEILESSNKYPQTNEFGTLSIFDKINKEVSENDVFFVIGKEKCKNQDPVAECLQGSQFSDRQKYPVRLNTSRYKLMRGSLIKDCDSMKEPSCGVYDCRNIWYESKEKVETNPFLSSKIQKHRRCEDIFGSQHAKGGQMETNERNEKMRNSKRIDICPCKSSLRCKDSNYKNKQEQLKPGKLLADILKERLEKYESEQKPSISVPDRKNILPPRFCPICCQNLILNSKSAPCPKCGHRPSSKTAWSDNQTADDILHQWDSDEKEFLENSGFSQYDHCTCEKTGKDCIYCRIRKMRNQLNDYGTGYESLTTGSQRESFLPKYETNRDNGNDDKLCDELVEIYGADPEAERAPVKPWKGNAEGAPHLSLVLDMLKRNLKNQQKSSNKGQERKDGNKKCNRSEKLEKYSDSDRTDVKLSREKRIKKMMENLCEGESEPPPPPCSPQKPKTQRQFIKDMKRKYCRRYYYPKRNKSCAQVISHQQCATESKHVPAKMGWLWNLDENKVRKGWRPGKIRRPIRELMHYFLTEFPVDSLPTTQELVSIVKPPLEPPEVENLVQKPTLQIRKRDGQYLITMNPLKDEKTLRYSADPYAKTKPIQFKITKEPIEMKRRQVKRYLKQIGFKKCSCHQPVSQCTCRSHMEKERLENSIGSICDLVQSACLKKIICLSDTTDSDSQLDIEFTPPAGVIKPHLLIKADLVETCTQYDARDYSCIEQFRSRTEQQIRQETKKKKRHICTGPINSIPCRPKPKPPRKFRKPKYPSGILQKRMSSKELAQSKSTTTRTINASKEARTTAKPNGQVESKSNEAAKDENRKK